MAVYGNETSDGAFLVHDVLVADLPPQIPLPVCSGKQNLFLQSYRVMVLVEGNLGFTFFRIAICLC